MNGERNYRREGRDRTCAWTVSGEMWSIVARRGNNADQSDTDAVAISRGRLAGEKWPENSWKTYRVTGDRIQAFNTSRFARVCDSNLLFWLVINPEKLYNWYFQCFINPVKILLRNLLMLHFIVYFFNNESKTFIVKYDIYLNMDIYINIIKYWYLYKYYNI